ncbi:penicillin-binding protein [Candidatus Roizmanbacteria bacterium CG_4_9_14_0_2_um_filter_39_13]|uniref:Penicillin-binding protein n=2 Tax=Candidatus Roizmaniibacteriota TaxID=1752723 RepID=A0A2M8EWJ4_9BACT|nr:MAG: penicillin-binding protein [Candidatus Roizmanbacteria bacterium CG_4_10_14_0_2_um_filter_39_12]PJC30238.1 MAG: penicillin-binding protein [Candidatus Roizmanbacteria bacterium CG_4_9_14_0_2_um_filter_39_13]PJE61812.1 MAG: penicillin-binding protein [Candidatus Roizmanbacteria bacterium CG10_big_fil_rev_8_21_14_0_10_39_12]
MSTQTAISFHVVYNWIVNTIYFFIYFCALFVVSLGEVLYKSILYPYLFTKNTFFTAYSFITSEKLPKNFKKITQTIWKILTLIPILVKNAFIFFFKLIESGVFWFLFVGISIFRFFKSIYFRYFIYGFVFCLLVIFVQKSYIFISDLPSPRSIGEVNFAQSTHLYDRNGRLLYEIFREFNRTKVEVRDLPDTIVHATIAIEDEHFYNHKGISFFGGILRAVKDTLATSELQGGSTITQQLVKTALLTPERTVERKLKEMVLALWTEQIYSKDQIMEMYLNQVAYGGSAYGVEEASKVYFNKKAQNLTLSEAALLAGLTRAPSVYSPFINPDLSEKRRNQVLSQMYVNGFITKQERDVAQKEVLNIQPPTTNIRAPHFVMYTRTHLEQDYGSKQLEEAGFHVTTSLDLVIQDKAQEILQEEIQRLKSRNISNGGIIVLRPDTGEILAMVGSVDYFSEKYGAFNVTTALRQPGSTLKPVLYSMALTRGFTAATRIDDSPIIFHIPGSESYQPVNYDRKFHGRIPIRQALANSYNIPAVKVLNTLGVQAFVDFAKNMGINTWEDSSRFGLSLSLGGGEVTLLDLTRVFGVFANGGYRIEPNPIESITDSRERKIQELYSTKTKVLDEGVSYIISDILADNNARLPAFGPTNSLNILGYTVSAKTGTTNDYRDAWTIGYTSKVVVGVWVGNNDSSSMNNSPGSLVAAPIFKRLMTYLLEEHDMAGEIPKPSNVIGKPCYAGKAEYFLKGTDSRIGCYDTILKPGTPTPKEEALNSQ